MLLSKVVYAQRLEKKEGVVEGGSCHQLPLLHSGHSNKESTQHSREREVHFTIHI